jgi:hypothetical protein
VGFHGCTECMRAITGCCVHKQERDFNMIMISVLDAWKDSQKNIRSNTIVPSRTFLQIGEIKVYYRS